MVESKATNPCSIQFIDNPKLMKKYLKKIGYKHNVKKQKDYLHDIFVVTISLPLNDRFVFSYLRAHHVL